MKINTDIYSDSLFTTPRQNVLTLKTEAKIDDVFNNKYENENKNKNMTVILTTDICNNYPIYHITLSQKKSKEEHCQLIRLTNGSKQGKYMNDIRNQNWWLANRYDSWQAEFTCFSESLKGILRCLPSNESNYTELHANLRKYASTPSSTLTLLFDSKT